MASQNSKILAISNTRCQHLLDYSCEGCVSGPTSPDFSGCSWPPGPAPDTTTTTTTKATTKPTTKPTARPTTTAFVDADCSYFEVENLPGNPVKLIMILFAGSCL